MHSTALITWDLLSIECGAKKEVLECGKAHFGNWRRSWTMLA
jgi:hypothetical protein